MGQMTAGQVLAQVDDLLPNSYPGEQKRRWLRQAEGFVLEEVVRAHEGGEAAELPDELADAAPLLAPAPYDGLYRHYVEAQIHYANGELREGGLIAEREYGGLDPDYRNWYTLTETGNAVA